MVLSFGPLPGTLVSLAVERHAVPCACPAFRLTRAAGKLLFHDVARMIEEISLVACFDLLDLFRCELWDRPAVFVTNRDPAYKMNDDQSEGHLLGVSQSQSRMLTFLSHG